MTLFTTVLTSQGSGIAPEHNGKVLRVDTRNCTAVYDNVVYENPWMMDAEDGRLFKSFYTASHLDKVDFGRISQFKILRNGNQIFMEVGGHGMIYFDRPSDNGNTGVY